MQVLSNHFLQPLTEEEDAEAYTVFAKCKLEVEKELSKMAGLNYVVIRPGIVYGTGDRYGLSKLHDLKFLEVIEFYIETVPQLHG
jgi:nucleoside-diphosphate-sugar epimerase